MLLFKHDSKCILKQYKKAKKLNPQNHLTDTKRQFLTSTLKVIVEKMKWDSDTSAEEDEFEDMDEDERAEFEKMRQVGVCGVDTFVSVLTPS